MIIYPAVDIMDGKCVRLRQGKPEAVKVYAEDPVEQAIQWEEQGAGMLHVVDLDGALTGKFQNFAVVKKIIKRLEIPAQLGGGARDLETVKRAFDAGCARVVIGTALIKVPAFALKACDEFGPDIVAALDARAGKVVISGWKEPTSMYVWELAEKLKTWGVGRIMSTDISSDGVLTGLNISGIKELVEKVDLPFIVSGGVAALEDLQRLRELEPLGVEGVIIGTALYEKKFSLQEAIEAAG